jgi:hypothetical protein
VHACQIQSAEDILSDPFSTPFTPEIDLALTPFIDILKMLLLNPERVDDANCPAKDYLAGKGLSLTETLVDSVGDINFLDRARVSNWFQVRIIDDKKIFAHAWLGRLPMAHALTILLASRLHYRIIQDPEFPISGSDEEKDRFAMQHAWNYQQTKIYGDAWIEIDVDHQCLEHLEMQMFERSARAGISGHWQWGLDTGTHQDGWNPYTGLPTHWYHDDREGSESELQVSPDSCSSWVRLRELRWLCLICTAWPRLQRY